MCFSCDCFIRVGFTVDTCAYSLDVPICGWYQSGFAVDTGVRSHWRVCRLDVDLELNSRVNKHDTLSSRHPVVNLLYAFNSNNTATSPRKYLNKY